MTHQTPPTLSVANTTKRAVLIWLSILLFGNPVTLGSGIGTAMVIGETKGKFNDYDDRALKYAMGIGSYRSCNLSFAWRFLICYQGDKIVSS